MNQEQRKKAIEEIINDDRLSESLRDLFRKKYEETTRRENDGKDS